MGTYGGGPSYLDVTVTLSDNVITAVTVEPQAENETSLDYQERFSNSQPFGSIFLEHKDVWGLKVRGSVGNMWNSKDHTQSVKYVARRDGPVDYTRDEYITWHPFLQLQVSGTF